MKNTKGFGLIEVLVAVAVIATAALLVSQFVTSHNRQQITVRSSADCEAGLNAVVAKIKELDNNSQIDSWMPTAAQTSPSGDHNFLQTRMRQSIYDGFPTATVGQVIATVDPRMNQYNANELGLAANLNNYQLIYSASSLLSSYYNTQSTYCSNAAGVAITRDQSDFLSQIVTEILGENVDVNARIQRVDLSSGLVINNCTSWDPVPVNASTNAATNTNSQIGFRLALLATYTDAAGNEKTCSTNSTFTPGGDLNPPTVSVTTTPITTGLVAGSNGLLCGTSTSAAFRFGINQTTNAEAGVQYFCRLDYFAGRYDETVNPAQTFTRSTGWFFCSAPEASIENTFNSPQLFSSLVSVTNVTVNNGINSSIAFQLNSMGEGSYKLHVKSVDVARNESPVTSRLVILDLTRPVFNATTPYVNPYNLSNVSTLASQGYRFQCADRNHSRWTTNIDEPISVSAVNTYHHYHSGITLQNALNCSSTTDIISDMNAPTNNQWNQDGPKTAEFMTCDECNILLGEAPARADALWFLDSMHTLTSVAGDPLSPSIGSLAAGRFTYDAGNNNGNPYVLEHRIYQEQASNPAQIIAPTIAATLHIRNSYNIATRTATSLIPVIFPLQTNINACQAFGTYTYRTQDGCGNDAWNIANRVKTQSFEYTHFVAGAQYCSGITSNIRYCPTFTSSSSAGVSFAPTNTCASLGLEDCNIAYNNGYCGENIAPSTSCLFRSNIHRACKQRSCNIPVAYRHLVGGRATIEDGETIYSCATNTVTCGNSCNCGTATCNNGTLSAPGILGTHASCSVGACSSCPSGTTQCLTLGQYSDCYEESPGLYCRPSSYSCSSPEVSCGTCSNGSTNPTCRDIDPSGGVVCCGTAPSCPTGQVVCTTPGSGGCPAIPNGDGLYCMTPTCTSGPYAWTPWVTNPPPDVVCAPGETPIISTHPQTRNCSGSSGIEAGCCTPDGNGTATSRNVNYVSGCNSGCMYPGGTIPDGGPSNNRTCWAPGGGDAPGVTETDESCCGGLSYCGMQAGSVPVGAPAPFGTYRATCGWRP